MKALKIVSVFLGILLAILLGVPVFLADNYEVERSMVINASPEEVFNNVADYNQYLLWNPWSRMEPSAKQEVSGTPKTVGHSWNWEGKEIGIGGMKITALEPGKFIKADLTFKAPMESSALDDWTFEAVDGGTKAVWHNAGGLDYPVGRWMGLMMDGMLGGQFEDGLKNLKELCEKQ